MNRLIVLAVASTFLTIGGVSAAFADDCTGHDHDTGTAVGAVGGAAIGGLASHSVVGGVVGGVAGNAIARDNDCSNRQAYEDDRDREHAYDQGYADRAAEEHQAMRDDYPN